MDFLHHILNACRQTEPRWLWLLLLIVPVAMGALAGPRTALRRWLAALGGMGAVAAVTLALSGTVAVWHSRQAFVVCAVDQSASIVPAGRAKAAAWVQEAQQARGDNVVECLPFAAQPGALGRAPAEEFPESGRLKSNLEAALMLARAAIPEDFSPHIVLLSDGQENLGHARRVVGDLRVPVSVVPLGGLLPDEVQLLDVTVVEPARAKLPHAVRVSLESGAEQQGELLLQVDAHVLARQKLHVRPGITQLTLDVTFPRPGEFLLCAELRGFRDQQAGNNVWKRPVVVEGEPRVLLVENPPGAADRLAAALRRAELDITLRSATPGDQAFADLRSFGVVILVNVPATSPHTPWMDRLAAAVQTGASLLVLGGDQAFTPGGYSQSRLEEILPVRSTVREANGQRDLAMAVLIDCSGSMEERKRLELAKEATRRAVENLRPGDQLGVLAYTDTATWVVPLGPCAERKRVLTQIASIEAGGSTNLLPALQRARLALAECFAAHKHVIVLTDGVSHMGDFRQATQQLAAAGISLSTVAVGAEPARPVLEEMARWGKGRFYDCPEAAAVPRAFTLETLGAGRRGISEGSLLARVARAPKLPDGWPTALPPLLGCCQTVAQGRAQVLYELSSGDPLLVSGMVGKGRTMVFTADVRNAWGGAWLAWPSFDAFWQRLVRQLLPPLVARPDVPHKLHAENYAEELRLALPQQSLLRELAQATGGTYAPSAAALFAADRPSVERRYDLRGWLLALALGLWLLQVALRRW